MGEGGQQQQFPAGLAALLGQAVGTGEQGLAAAQWQGLATTAAAQLYGTTGLAMELCGCEECMRRGGRLGRGYPNSPSFTAGEFAEEYYEQCFGTPLTPQQRAQKLLFEHLTKQEQKDWSVCQQIGVTAKSGRRYVISANNVERMDDGHTFCIVVGDWPYSYHGGIPVEDRIFALKLLIETNEEQFLKIAVERGTPPQTYNDFEDQGGAIVDRLQTARRYRAGAKNPWFKRILGFLDYRWE